MWVYSDRLADFLEENGLKADWKSGSSYYFSRTKDFYTLLDRYYIIYGCFAGYGY